MVQSGSGARLLQETATAIFLCERVGRQHFERYYALELLVARFIDRAHPARAQRLDDAIVCDKRAGFNHDPQLRLPNVLRAPGGALQSAS